MNLVDVLIIGFVLLGALQGYRKGLLTGLVNLLASVAGLVVAASQYLNVYNWLQRTFSLQAMLEGRVYKLVLPRLESQASQKGLGEILSSLPEGWRELLGLPNLSSLPAIPTQPVTQPIYEEAAHRLAGIIAQNLLYLLAFALIYLVVVTLIQIVWAMIMAPFGKVGGAANRGGGLILGGMGSLLGLTVVAGLMSPLVKLGFSGTAFTLIQSSFFYPYLLNIFDLLLKVFSVQVIDNFRLNLPNGVWF